MAPQFLNKGGKSDLTSAKAGKKGRRKFDKSNARKLSVTEKESSTKGKCCGRKLHGDLASSVKQPCTDTPQKNFPAVAEENIPICIEEELPFHDHEKCIEEQVEVRYRSCLGMSKKFYSSNPADNLETEDELKNEVWTFADVSGDCRGCSLLTDEISREVS